MHNRRPTAHERAILFLAEPVNAAVAAAFAIAALIAALTVAAGAARSAPDGCTAYTVVRGDTASQVALRHDIPWPEFVAANQHIDDLNRIFPGDELVVGPCEQAPQHLDAAAVAIDLERHPDGRLTAAGICRLAAIHFPAAEVVTATAVGLAESNGRTEAQGDLTIQTSKWGPSVGVFQIRTLWDHRGTGDTRDIDALTDPLFNAAAARTIFDGAGGRWTPWGAYTHPKGAPAYERRIDEARAGCASIGVTR